MVKLKKSKNDPIKEKLLKIFPKYQGGISQDFIDKVNEYSDEELFKEYSELKAVSEGNDLVQGTLIFSTFVAFLAGAYQLFSDFSRRGDLISLDETKYSTLVSGFFFFIGSSVLLVLLLLLLYIRSVRNRKAKFYYVETIMKRRKILG